MYLLVYVSCISVYLCFEIMVSCYTDYLVNSKIDNLLNTAALIKINACQVQQKISGTSRKNVEKILL